MLKVYEVEYGFDNLLGVDENGQLIKLGVPVYYNSFNGLLYTDHGSYVIISFYPGEEYQTNEYINQCLTQIWAYV